MKLVLQCLFSPRLYKVYKENIYQPNIFERLGDKVVITANTLLNITIYTSPLICMYVYRRGFYSMDESKTMIKYFSGLGCLLALSIILRGFGRAYNPKYVEFLQVLNEPVNDQKMYLKALRNYDFDFSAWPVSYAVPPNGKATLIKNGFKQCANHDLPAYKRVFIQVLAFVATHTFGLRMIYVGTLGLIHTFLDQTLLQGRSLLVELYDGKRAKILTSDQNTIDTMLVDNRNKTEKGKLLVVCCEGNSGFYEIGIMTTPIKAGYSALGWNHPGFRTSTGKPFPSQEQNAIDGVMQYAVNELKFKPSEIVLFGWSIGGYTATWAAVNYPDIKALILDATFDDLLPLAIKQMPDSWCNLVKEVIKCYVDLNIGELLIQYNGPVQLVRRTKDEIICVHQGLLASNRCNNLLIKLIEARHSDQIIPLMPQLCKYVGLVDTQRADIENSNSEDIIIQPLRMIRKYMRDYNSSHCTPLPEKDFEAIMASITTEN